jgi:membrane protein DedA with SNARE-associated domain
MRTSIVKAYIGITLIVTSILVGLCALSGSEVTSQTFGYALLIAAIASAAVMLIWYFIGMLIMRPVVRFFAKTFELIGKY